MADKRAELRRRRILENPGKRLEKLQNLSKIDDFDTNQHSQGSVIDNQCSQQPINPDGDGGNEIKDDGDNLDVDNDSYKVGNENDVCGDNNSHIDGDLSTDEKTEDVKQSWIMKKYRLILFVLLGWGIYMVVEKEFDFILAYLIGKRLPKGLLPNLILSAFVAVELQVMLVSMFLQKSPESKSQSMFILALTLCGIPRNILNFIGKVTSMFMSAFTDLCVYIFVIVALKTLDAKV